MAIETSAHIDAQGTNVSDKTVKIWKDLNLNFTKHPLTNDVNRVYDVEAIKRSVKHLILTSRGSRPFQPWLGSDIPTLLFEPMDVVTMSSLERAISILLDNFEPRIKLISVEVDHDESANRMHVRLSFKIVGFMSGNVYTLDTFLDRIK
jgi:phage baseplate assembly protein W